jgi:hypothetical protein
VDFVVPTLAILARFDVKHLGFVQHLAVKAKDPLVLFEGRAGSVFGWHGEDETGSIQMENPENPGRFELFKGCFWTPISTKVVPMIIYIAGYKSE